MAARKLKLHLNWNTDKQIWETKKAFGFLPIARTYSEDDLRTLLSQNENIDVVLKYE